MPYQIELPVVGVTFRNPDGVRRQEILENALSMSVHNFNNHFDSHGYPDVGSSTMEDLQLAARQEPWNKYDSNAIAIHITAPESCAGQIGYISREDADRYAPLFKAGQYLSCTLSSLGRQEETGNIGMNIFIRFAEADPRAQWPANLQKFSDFM
jgi:hypothetical protein